MELQASDERIDIQWKKYVIVTVVHYIGQSSVTTLDNEIPGNHTRSRYCRRDSQIQNSVSSLIKDCLICLTPVRMI